ncbi:MAG TPA: AI-2E family transporter [Bryobacteraceae bacterium]|jgi:predicted PurR-regulated permease PerM
MSLREPVVQSVRVLGLFVRARILIALIQTILFAIGFAFARVPLWPLIAIAGGLGSFIPRIGVLVPLVLVAIADLFGGVDLLHWTYAFGVWFVILLFDEFYLTPRLLSKPLGLRPLPVFLALIAGSFFFGPIGFILAVPVLAIAAVFWRYFRDRQTQ